MLLRPVLTRFVQAFAISETNSAQDTDFWGRVCHYTSGGSGSTYLSGWVTAFCVWNDEGKWMGPGISSGTHLSRILSFKMKPKPPSLKLNHRRASKNSEMPHLVLDDVPYTFINSDDIPPGYCEVDVKLDDNGKELPCVMVSGSMGSTIIGEKDDTLQPLPAWFIFVSEKVKKLKDI